MGEDLVQVMAAAWAAALEQGRDARLALAWVQKTVPALELASVGALEQAWGE
jgi:hypothetical protein